MQHKALVAVKQRAMTFSMVFAVVLAAAGIAITSTAVRTVPCQARADELVLPLLVSPFVANTTIFDATLISVKRLDLNVRFKRRNESTTSELTALDLGGRIARNGYRLIREHRGETFTWSLRYISTRLCNTQPPYSMDVAANSDYETDNRRIIATLPNETLYFVRESSLTSRLSSRVANYDTFQSTFPSFRRISGSGAWDRSDSYSIEVVTSSTITNDRGRTDVRLDVEAWSKAGKFQFWRIVVRTDNPNEQEIARAVFSSVKTEYAARGIGFGGIDVADLFEWCGIA